MMKLLRLLKYITSPYAYTDLFRQYHCREQGSRTVIYFQRRRSKAENYQTPNKIYIKTFSERRIHVEFNENPIRLNYPLCREHTGFIICLSHQYLNSAKHNFIFQSFLSMRVGPQSVFPRLYRALSQPSP